MLEEVARPTILTTNHWQMDWNTHFLHLQCIGSTPLSERDAIKWYYNHDPKTRNLNTCPCPLDDELASYSTYCSLQLTVHKIMFSASKVSYRYVHVLGSRLLSYQCCYITILFFVTCMDWGLDYTIQTSTGATIEQTQNRCWTGCFCFLHQSCRPNLTNLCNNYR